MVRLTIAALALTISVVSPVGLLAQEEHGGEHAVESEEQGETEGHAESGHGEEHHHKNHIALFLGSTQGDDHHGERDDPQFTVGLDYERRLTKIVGVGLLVDVVVEGHREGIVAVPLFLHAGRLTFQLAAGGERIRESGDWESFGRLGGLYEFKLRSGFTLSPAVFYDVTEEGGTWVLGVNLGKGF